MTPTPQIAPNSTQLGLVGELERTPTSYIGPYAFFVSWNGVLTLAFNGFTPAVINLKQRLFDYHPALPPEASGSKWPKTSIGCLNDGVTLSREQFETLNALCKSVSAQYFSSSAPQLQIALDAAAITLYECRSLERLIFQNIVLFSGTRDGAGPSEEEQNRVKLIVAEADAPDYYSAVAREGNRASHYKSPALGATLVYPLVTRRGADSPRSPSAHMGLRERGVQELTDRRRLLEIIKEFKSQVDAVLPGCYVWFEGKSLHITLRAIIL